MCIFKAVKKQSGIGFIVDALFGNFAILHNLYTVIELHTSIVLIHFESRPMCNVARKLRIHHQIFLFIYLSITMQLQIIF